MRYFLLLFFAAMLCKAKAQSSSNDEAANATVIADVSAYCSADAAYSNIGASSSLPTTVSWNGPVGKDVWFRFTAKIYDINITVSGKVNAASTNTLISPVLALYEINPATGGFSENFGSTISSNNITTLYKGALIPGREYLIRVSATNDSEGTFKLCVDNYFAPLVPGQDCATVSVLCNMGSFTQNKISGAGLKNNETAGTCLGTESNSAWYMWTASKSGAFTFLITPTATTNDIDWVLFDLGVGGTCNQAIAANAIRCAAGNGINCTPSYYITGLSMTETDLSEESGCPSGSQQNGLVRYVDMIAGHNYALIIDNFSSGVNGFHIEFGGTTEFAGPTADFKMATNNACLPKQDFTFTNLSSNYQSLTWTFGNDASIKTSNAETPITVTYASSGEKVVVLEAKSATGCSVVKTFTFTVSIKPILPIITFTTVKLCPGNTITLNTAKLDNATYHWSGPNGFTSSSQNPEIVISGPENSGDYELYVEVDYCKSDIAKINIPTIDPKPEALFDIVVNSKCLSNQNFSLVNNSINYKTINWDFGTGINTQITSPNGNTQIVYSTNGLKNITLTVTSESGCVSTLMKQIEVQTKPTTPIITSNQKAFCLGDVIKLAIDEGDDLTYFWTGPNNFTANTPAISVPAINTNLAGVYRVFTKNGDCPSDVATFIVPPISKIPVASFGTIPTAFYSKYSPPLKIVFRNSSKDADSYLWDFGDGLGSNEESPTHTYTKSGTYKIRLTATANEGCSTSATIGDLIITNATLFVPNAFSPNNDGINDEFTVTILNLKKYRISIYNRLGTLVFNSFNIFDSWKGKYKNESLPVGVYYYVITGTNIDELDLKYSGSVTLIR